MYPKLMDQKAQGLCFWCDEKYHSLHQCLESQLQLLILGNDEVMTEIGEVLAVEVADTGEEEVIECQLWSLVSPNHAVDGTCEKGLDADSGASHNFISPQVAATLDLLVTMTPELGVRLGDGYKITTRGKCSYITIEAYVLDFGGLDIILGVAWLKGLGKVVMD
ncbi:hypothetical protein CR513_53726, partial [Mucuna pruriens]